jgi:hypothetical protein
MDGDGGFHPDTLFTLAATKLDHLGTLRISRLMIT